MSLFIVDVEADGPAPGLYSMVSFGIVKVNQALDTSFYGQVKPITDSFIPEALAVSGHSRKEHEGFSDPAEVMKQASQWLLDNNGPKSRPVFVSDNPAFDWQFMNYYFHAFTGNNPFGFSARRIGDFYAGLERDFFKASAWKSLRKTSHTHHPVDDAKGNAEALLEMARIHRIRLPL